MADWRDYVSDTPSEPKSGWEGAIGSEPESEVPKWGEKNPNLYGAYGAAKEVLGFGGRTALNAVKNTAEIGKGLFDLGMVAVDPRKRSKVARTIADTLTTPGAPTAVAKAVGGAISHAVQHPVETIEKHPLDVALLVSGGAGLLGKGAKSAGMLNTAEELAKLSRITDPIQAAIKAGKSVAPMVKGMTPKARVGRDITLAREAAGAKAAEADAVAAAAGTRLTEAERTGSPELMAAQRNLSVQSDRVGGINPAQVAGDLAAEREAAATGVLDSTRAGDTADLTAKLKADQTALEEALSAAQANLASTQTGSASFIQGLKDRAAQIHKRITDRWTNSGGSIEDLHTPLTAEQARLFGAKEAAAGGFESAVGKTATEGGVGGTGIREGISDIKSSLKNTMDELYGRATGLEVPDWALTEAANAVDDVVGLGSAIGKPQPILQRMQTRLAQAGVVPEVKGVAKPLTPEASAEYLAAIKAGAEGGESVPMTIGDLNALRSWANGAQYGDSTPVGRSLRELVKRLNAVESKMLESGVEGVEDLKIARDFARNEYYPLFGEGAMGDMALKQGGGDFRTLSTELIKKFAPTDKNKLPNAVAKFNAIFKNAPERGRAAIIEAFRTNLGNIKGGLNEKTVAKWLADNEAGLKAYGVENEFSDVASTLTKARAAAADLAAFEKTKVGKLVGIPNLETVIPKQLSQQSGSVGFLNDLADMAALDGSGAATEGVKQLIAEHILSSKGVKQTQLLSTVQKSKMFTPKELHQLKRGVAFPEKAEGFVAKAQEAANASVAAAEDAVSSTSKAVKEFGKSKAAEMLNISPEKLGRHVIGSQKNMQAAIAATEGAPEARAGLQTAVSDAVKKFVGDVDMANPRSVRNTLRKLESVMTSIGPQLEMLYTPEQMAQHKALIETMKRIGGVGVQAVKLPKETKGLWEFLASIGGYAAKLSTKNLGAYPMGSKGVRLIEKVFQNKLDYHMTRALFDPGYADDLYKYVQNINAPVKSSVGAKTGLALSEIGKLPTEEQNNVGSLE